MPALRARLQHYTGERPLFDLYNVEQEIEKALARRVDLKSGGTLVIDQTEAMTTIDVNTGGFVGQRNFDDTVFKTNLERRRRSRASCGCATWAASSWWTFIDMDSAEHRGRGAGRTAARARARPHAHDGERLHRARAGGDDAQAHARIARARAMRALRDLRGPRPAENPRAPCATRCCAKSCARRAAFQAKEFRVLASQPVCDLFLEEESGRAGDAFGIHRQTGFQSKSRRDILRNNMTSCCYD